MNIKKIVALSIACVSLAGMMTACGSKKDPYKAVEYQVTDYVKLGTYTGLSVDEVVTIVSDADIEDALEQLVSEKTTYTEVTDRYAQLTDRVSISYTRTVEGEATEDSKTSVVELGASDFGEDFDNHLVGLNTGGNLEFTIEEYIENTQTEDADAEDEDAKDTDADTEDTDTEDKDAEAEDKDAEESDTEDADAEEAETEDSDADAEDEEGSFKNVTYNVTVSKIEEKNIPEVTDAFIAENTDYQTVAEYKEGTRAEKQEQNNDNAVETAKTNLLNQVVEVSTVDNAPSFLYNLIYNSTAQSYATYAGYFGMDLEGYLEACGMSIEDVQKTAVESAKIALVAEAILQDAGIEIDDEEYEATLDEWVTKYGWESKEKIKESFSKEQLLMDMRNDKAKDYLYENSTVNHVEDKDEE